MPKGRVRRHPVAKLHKCPQCKRKSLFIYRCDDGKDRCIVCLIKEGRAKRDASPSLLDKGNR